MFGCETRFSMKFLYNCNSVINLHVPALFLTVFIILYLAGPVFRVYSFAFRKCNLYYCISVPFDLANNRR
jgi:hypothetical protein